MANGRGMTLGELTVGQRCMIERVGNQRGEVKRRLVDMGLTPGTVVKLVNNLVPSLQEGDPFFVSTFLSTYRSFVTPLQVLGLLFMR